MGKRNGDKPLCYVWGRGLGFASARGHRARRLYRAGRLASPELVDASLRGQGLPLALAQRLEVANASGLGLTECGRMRYNDVQLAGDTEAKAGTTCRPLTLGNM